MKYSYIFIFLILCLSSKAQRDYHWAFGDSSGIDFSSGSPLLESGRILSSEEASASISDQNGNLLFYVANGSILSSNNGSKKYIVRDANDSIMPGGDSLAGHYTVTQGLLILPDPGDTNKYYIFHIKHGSNYFYCSIVDMTGNGGMGAVTSSNILLEDSVTEKMHAVKVGNGRDWFLATTIGYSTIYFTLYKIDSTGVHFFSRQLINTNEYSATGQMIFSKDGSKLLFTGGTTSSILYDFDRCIGEISNPVTLLNFYSSSSMGRYGCSFSPSGRYLYLSALDSLWQFDTQAANISLSKQLILTMPYTGALPDYVLGQHMLGPDGKIYIANASVFAGNPHDSLNTHLTIINFPDSPAVSCGLTPYSFSLNGKKCYGNLPNMPNYNLGALENINCDSILSINEAKTNAFSVFPNPGNGRFTLTSKSQLPDKLQITISNANGRTVFKKTIMHAEKLIQLDVGKVAGVYFLQLNDGHGLYNKKLVVVQ